MTPQEVLEHYHGIETRSLEAGLEYHSKPGVRGYPELPPGLELLLDKADLAAEALLDATGSAGLVALAAREAGGRTVLEPSAAALLCAKATLAAHPDAELAAGLPWDAPGARFDLVCLLPQTDRGNLRTLAELAGAHAALKPGGRAYLVIHKDQGAKRYEKQAQQTFGELSVVARRGGWRLSRAVKTKLDPVEASPVSFNAAGLELRAEPGVFAAGKLDPGTALLLEQLDLTRLAGRSVLDLGCGYGMIALKASLVGAAVTALDDDLGAVRSTYANAKTYGLDLRCLHSDVDSELKPEERFDAVLMNPPFHVGKQVRLDVPRAFLAAAYKHLRPGGVLTLVANKALRYEQELEIWTDVQELAQNQQFKVLQAVRPA